ncbi:MAG: hypothetical protein GY714_32085 [Desulfobacterales bacterium]|nr:hypothetical protein [Desulfobacterales bacterium]
MLIKSKSFLYITILVLCVSISQAVASSGVDLNISNNQNLNSVLSINTLTVPLHLNHPEDYKFDHIGIVVKDIEKSISFYSKVLNLKFSDIHEYQLDNVNVRGKKTSYKMQIAFAGIKPIRIELIEIVNGESLHTEFLKSKGQGIQHLAFDVKDLKKEIGNAKGLGLELITYFEQVGVPVMAYFETGNGMILELVQENVMERIKEAKKLSE